MDANRLQDTTSTYISLKNRQVKAEVGLLHSQGRDLCCCVVASHAQEVAERCVDDATGFAHQLAHLEVSNDSSS